MSVKITNVQPCSDWFFVAPANQSGGKPIVYRLAAWATAVDGEEGQAIVGLVPVMSTGKEEVLQRVPRLVPVPAIGGSYKHLKDLAPTEASTIE
ncbi:Uncharacterised protein [Burkholderia pseudomallei]|nr:Uncharacterised protein [Burkholderia pseudomallei]